ncbi:MAG: LacI family DNA-binding transcriptional regulator [Pseudonocardia sp.]|nr:LacI family DNA-binding transcriptional regulator [Pseudonocardia sp.]OJY42721.1 MAG: hypothetical protein BGP03_28095 [Pseudonocardia sp. 73-21]
MSSPAPVMADVARLAGVSLQTVSRVVNDAPNVSGPTRARVLAVMDELGYRRNAVARALATRRSGIIGVLTIDVVLRGPQQMLYGVERAASRLGLGVAVAVVDRVTPDGIRRALGRLQDQGVEGVVALAPHEDAVPVLTASLSAMPAVLVGGHRAADGPNLPTVELDHHGGAVAATRYLLELGHRTVHHLAGPPRWLPSRRRIEGWSGALAAAGARRPEPRRGEWTARSGHAVMRELLADDPGLTSVFVANDQMALGALAALTDAGRRVPDDVSMIGFDDTPEAPFFRPALTTVCPRFDDAGNRAVRMLLAAIRPDDAPAAPGSQLVPVELVVRASTGPPP